MSQDIAHRILNHLRRRPAARPRDIYKLLYQGVFGVGHIVTGKAKDILTEEAGRISLKEHSEDPLFEPVSPDGSMVRVNLRQYLLQGGDLDKLYIVMQESAKIKGETEVFLGYWGQFKKLVANGVVSYPLSEVEELDKLMKHEGVKPMHHTEEYREAYYPAYRVVSLQIYEKIMDTCG
jgi:hypothetical protein